MKTIKHLLSITCLAFSSLSSSAMELPDTEDAKLAYIATWPDLISAFGANFAAGGEHYDSRGHAEYRYLSAFFDPLAYLADQADVAVACGFNETTAEDPHVLACGARHFIIIGFREGRSWSDLIALSYIASYPDLMNRLGSDPDLGRTHYLQYGKSEGRQVTFNIVGYVKQSPNRFKSYRTNYEGALAEYIDNRGSLPY